MLLDGIFNVNKPAGMTSHDVVNFVRRLSGQRRVGHAGTLDPAAEGVLLVCLGKATKVVEYLTNDRKAYVAAATLGVITDTYDAEGQVVGEAPVTATRSEVEAALSRFRGGINQVPPRYSALKLGGQPLYKLARAGVEVKPQPRPVIIYQLDLLDWQSPVATLYVQCSKGTYIRSLAYDLGQALGCGGHLSKLRRVASGHFTLATASTPDELKTAYAQGEAEELLFALDTALIDYDALIVDDARASAVRNGTSWPAARAPGSSSGAAAGSASARIVGDSAPVRVYSCEGEIVAMVDYDGQSGRWQPAKVF